MLLKKTYSGFIANRDIYQNWISFSGNRKEGFMPKNLFFV